MDNKENHERDIIQEYIDPEMIEKAPKGFSQKTMARIRIEAGRVPVRERLRFRYLTPFIAGLVTIILITSLILVEESDGSSVFSFIAERTGISNIALPQLEIDLFTGIDLPSVTIYLVIGIFILAVFDRLLSLFFHRKRDKSSSLIF